MKELLLRTITGILLIVLVLGSILLGPVPFLIITLLIYCLGLRELFPLYESKNPVSLIIVSLAGGTLMFTTYLILESYIGYYWLVLPVLIWIAGFFLSGYLRSGLLVLFWIAVPLSLFLSLGWSSTTGSYDHLLPLSVVVLVWVNDTFAFVVGSLLGKHKMTPKLSPRKTWEGFFGGILFSALAGWIIYQITGVFSPFIWITCAVIVSLFGLCGDLFESYLKRKRNVKNTGGILPGHGGVLDRFDSLLFVAPVVYLLLLLLKEHL